LGIDRAGLEPSVRHFRQFSNMSSASVIHILKDLLEQAKPDQEFRWLSMGAGFHVVSGVGRKL
jgi:predicted naringenin-chalcone synthase